MPDKSYNPEQIGQIVKAAEAFVEGWKYLAPTLPSDYSCFMTCTEAEVLADLFTAVGKAELAEWILEAHTEGDEPGDAHHPSE